MAEKKTKIKGVSYKGKPIVRSGNIIYYGDINDPYIVFMQVNEETDFQGGKIPSRISVQVFSTDESLPLLERIVKGTEKKNMYEAMKIASIWLERALSGSDMGED